jgi:hypothetical protein
VIDEMQGIDRAMSPHKPESELSRINRDAGSALVPISEEMTRLLQLLIDRMTSRPGLRVLVCLPLFFDTNVSKAMQRIRDNETTMALNRLNAGGRSKRVAVFSPSAGPARTLRIATTSVIVDDAWAIVGTKHLWRRGLTCDSSYAIALCDDRMVNGRSEEVQRFRRQLCANRLEVAANAVPDDPAELIDSVRTLVARGGFGRLAADRLRPHQDEPTTLTGTTFTEADVWNPDGSPPANLNP